MITGGGGGSSTPAFAFGTAAARPAASAANAKTGYYATDTGEISFSDGASWNSLSSTSNYFSFNNGSGANFPAGNPIFFDHNGQGITLKSTGGQTVFLTNAGLDLGTVGKGLAVAEGSNAKQGTYGPLVAGTLAVANTSVTASSRIIVCRSPGGTNPGGHNVSAITAGTGFTVTSTNAADTGSGVFQIFEPG